MLLSVTAAVDISAFAETSGDYSFKVLDETKKTAEISGYTGSDEEITIPSTVTTTDEKTNEVKSYTVTSIGMYAFSSKKIKSVVIPNGVTNIAWGAFREARNLTSITVPDSVTRINIQAFHLTGYYNDSSNWENDVLYLDNWIIAAKNTVSGAYEIKSGTKAVADYAFDKCTGLTSLTIPASTTIISDNAFYGCTNLKNVTYAGTKDQWSKISIRSGNDSVNSSTIQCSDGIYVAQSAAANTANTANTATDTTAAKTDSGATQAAQNNQSSSVTSVTKPKATKIKSLKALEKSFTVHWKKVKGVSGYQIQYSTSKKMKKAKTKNVKGSKKTKATVKKLKKGKKYYVRIRTYKTVNGKKVYSKWSAKKTVKTK